MEKDVVSHFNLACFRILRTPLKSALAPSVFNYLLFRATWRKKFFNREKRRELIFRQKLMDKVQAAEAFDPKVCLLLNNSMHL